MYELACGGANLLIRFCGARVTGVRQQEACRMSRLSDGYLLDAASGAAPEAVRVLAACHTALNPAAAARAAGAERAAGALLEGVDPAPVSPAARERVLALTRRFSASSDEPQGQGRLFPEPLDAHVQRQTGGILAWKTCYGGRQEIVLDALGRDGIEASLIRMAPGVRAPRHDHEGEELTLVLSGAFHDGHRSFRRGEVCEASAGHAHQPAAEGEEPCVCFAVTIGALRPTNPLLAAANRLWGERRSR